MSGLIDSIKKNHIAQMAICCAIPVIVILALQFAGIREWWVYPLALVVCIGSHAIMMLNSTKEGKKACH